MLQRPDRMINVDAQLSAVLRGQQYLYSVREWASRFLPSIQCKLFVAPEDSHRHWLGALRDSVKAFDHATFTPAPWSLGAYVGIAK